MKTFNKILFIALSLTATTSFANGGASQNVSAAGKHSALAVAHGTVATAKVGSAVLATPLIAVGFVGKASMTVGDELMGVAISNEPLEVTEKTITKSAPPAEMMKTNKQETL